MKWKRKLVLLAILVLLLLAASYCFPGNSNAVRLYDRFLFYPFQSLRIILVGWFPFSLGDLLYVTGGILLLVTLGRWVKYTINFRACRGKLAASVLNTIITVLFVYLFFILGWGANYYKPALRESWGLQKASLAVAQLHDTVARRIAIGELSAFDHFLVEKLNRLAPHYRHLPFADIARRSQQCYYRHTSSPVKEYGLQVKPTLFGYFLERTAIEGFYNPFTGEGQVNTSLPSFILPFVICHEMAHQAGVAAEGDANLLAYALCTATADTSFQYSAYLNIWLYTNTRLFHKDSARAIDFAAMLNAVTKAHLDTLEQLRRKHQNDMARYSSDIYDGYLKMQDQKDGIYSYGNVSADAWLLEKNRGSLTSALIYIP